MKARNQMRCVFVTSFIVLGYLLYPAADTKAQSTTNATSQSGGKLSGMPMKPHARPAPKALKLFYKGQIFSAPNAASSPGYVEATDSKSGQKLWGKVIYTEQTTSSSSTNGVFITSMEVLRGQLNVFNQNRVRYFVDISTGNVTSSQQPPAAPTTTTPSGNVKK